MLVHDQLSDLRNCAVSTMQLRITYKCNGNCSFCEQPSWSKEKRTQDMSKDLLYKYLAPLYSNICYLSLLGGEPTVSKETLPYCKFISETYPHITLGMYTNGIAFNQEWAEFAADNLMRVRISLNAASPETYHNGVWRDHSNVFERVDANIKRYVSILKLRGLECFSPGISMVVTEQTACDVYDFVKYALVNDLSACTFHFDASGRDNTTRTKNAAILELMKLERVLAGKFFLLFRMYIHTSVQEVMQQLVEKIPLEALNEEYSDILTLATHRSMQNEFLDRQKIRRTKGKRELTFDEDWTPFFRYTECTGKKTCGSAFSNLEIYPDGRYDICCFINPRFKLDFEKEVDWKGEYNRIELEAYRKNMLSGQYDYCLPSCPVNLSCVEPNISHKYGFYRANGDL